MINALNPTFENQLFLDERGPRNLIGHRGGCLAMNILKLTISYIKQKKLGTFLKRIASWAGDGYDCRI